MVSSRVPPSLFKLEWALQTSRGYNHWASRKASTGLNWEEGSCVQGTVASCLQNGKSQLAGYQDTCSGRSEERTDGALSQGLPEKGHLHLDARDPVRALKGLEDSD